MNLQDRDNLRTKDKRPVPKVSFVRRLDCIRYFEIPLHTQTMNIIVLCFNMVLLMISVYTYVLNVIIILLLCASKLLLPYPPENKPPLFQQ